MIGAGKMNPRFTDTAFVTVAKPSKVNEKHIFLLILHQPSPFSIFCFRSMKPQSAYSEGGRGSIEKYFRIFLRPMETMK
jgi:hypothetical protein